MEPKNSGLEILSIYKNITELNTDIHQIKFN